MDARNASLPTGRQAFSSALGKEFSVENDAKIPPSQQVSILFSSIPPSLAYFLNCCYDKLALNKRKINFLEAKPPFGGLASKK